MSLPYSVQALSRSVIAIGLLLSPRAILCVGRTERLIILETVLPEAALDAGLKRAVRDCMRLDPELASETFFNYNNVDLDNDGVNEYLVYVFGRDVCGSGGCTTLIMNRLPTLRTPPYGRQSHSMFR